MHVYLQPLASDADRIVFSIDAASAVADAGPDSALTLSLTTVRQPDVARQRLLASGPLPAGSYAGLSLSVRKASLRRERGETALLAPDTPVRVDGPFVVAPGRALVLWLTFDPADSVAGGVSFTPTFSARVAPRPMVSRAGFVSNSNSDSVTVFDKRVRQATAVIAIGCGPFGMALDQRSGKLYVACPREDEVQSIDVAAEEIVERTRLAPGDGPRELVLTPDGRTLVSVNPGSNSVSFFDADPLTRLERVSVENGPASIAIDPAGRRAFVFNTLSSSISVLDIARRAVVATISMDAAPLRGQFNLRGDRLFVIHERSPYVTVIDPQQLAIVTRARTKLGVGSIKVDSRRALVYMGGRDEAAVEFYDPNTLLPVGSMSTGVGVSYMAIDAEDNSLYVVSPDTRRLVIGSLADRKVASAIDVGEAPYWVAVMGER